MRLVGGSVAALVALAVAALIVGDLIASAAGLIGDAGWYAPIALAFPLFMAVAVWRHWGTPNY